MGRNAVAERAQSALEYLTTYGWAILVLAIVLAGLYALGLFSPSSFTHSTCTLEADFSCLSTALSSNGVLFVNIEQSTPSPINVTRVSCTTDVYSLHPLILSPVAQISVGGNQTFDVQCWTNSSKYSGSLGSIYTGYLVINYTSQQTGFPHTIYGPIVQKVVH